MVHVACMPMHCVNHESGRGRDVRHLSLPILPWEDGHDDASDELARRRHYYKAIAHLLAVV